MNDNKPRTERTVDPLKNHKIRIYSSKDGMPLKTEMANAFPLLSRRERWAMVRAARKHHNQPTKAR